MSDVYLCYSRKDSAFVRTLNEALKKSNCQSWVDWEGIAKGTEWWKEIQEGIEGADTFVFVMSPDSLVSKVCQDEINHAVRHNKQILPIVYRDAHELLDTDNPAHNAIGKLNCVFFRDTDDFYQSFQELIDALNLDIAHIKGHTRLLTRALEWDNKGRKKGFLLKDESLAEAEYWLEVGVDKDPKPTDLQKEYIQKSREVEGGKSSTILNSKDAVNKTIQFNCLAFQYAEESRLFALDKEGNIWIINFPEGVWEKYESKNTKVPLKEIVIQSNDNSDLFGLDEKGKIWTVNIQKGLWKRYDSTNADVSFKKLAVQSGSDSYLFALDVEGQVWGVDLSQGEWKQNWPSTPNILFETITVQSGDTPYLFALDKEGSIWSINLPGEEWKQWPATPGVRLKTITVQSGNDPHLFALDREGKTWAIGLPGGGWVQGWPVGLDVPLQVITAQSNKDGNIYLFGLDEERNIWFMDWFEGVWIKNRWNVISNEEIKQTILKSYIGQELQNDLAQGVDQLSIKTEIDALTNVLMLRELKPPLAVGILGGWGSGKSFALHLMKERINEIRSEALTEKQAWGESDQLFPYVGHIYQIEFDAWTYAKSNLWASLMQKVFFELNRQISLEETLKKAKVDLLKGGQVWKILNNMSDEQRQSLLNNEELMRDLFKSPDLYENWKKSKSSQEFSSVLWSKFGELRQEEVKKLKEEQESLLNAQNELKKKQIDIDNKVDKKISEESKALQWKPLQKELKDLMGDAFKIFESRLTKVTDQNQKIETEIIANNVKTILNELEPEFWQSLLKTFKKNPILSILFLISFLLLVFSPLILTSLNEWLSQNTLLSNFVKQRSILLTTSPVVISGIPFVQKAWKGWKKYKKQVKQVLERYQTQVIDEQEKLAQSRQTLIEIEKATDDGLIKLENDIKKKEAFVEQQQQRIGLTTVYKSLNELIDIRHQTDPYSEQLGLLQQVKSDIEELTNCLVIQEDDSPETQDKKRESFVRGPARVVLYIDDLDRCPPHKVVEVLEAVQLLVKTSLFIVVLAIDDRYISRALEDVYKGVLKRRGKPSGIDYLEKIIQIPYRMRSISLINLKSYLQSQMTVEEEQSEALETIPTPKIPTSKPSQSNTPKTTKTDSPDVNQEKKPELTQLDETKVGKKAPERKPISINQEKTPELPKPEPSPQNSETISEIIKFTRSEFDLLANCAKHVDLSPRTGKRLINLYKILKIVWSQYPSLKLKEPDTKTKQIAITFLALSGRYPDFTRHLFEEIDTKFEESSDSNQDNPVLTWKLQALLNELKKQVSKNDHHNQREWRKFEHDLYQMLEISPPQKDQAIEDSSVEANNDSFSLDRETFRLALSFCFVGDIGYDPDDYHLPQITNH